MFGTINVKTRPLRLGFLIEPNRAEHLRGAIRLASTLWGGAFFPIIPAHKRMPTTWREGPLRAPKASDVVSGYIEAFDLDLLVDFCPSPHASTAKTGIERIKPEDVWKSFEKGESIAATYGVGVFEILDDIYEKHFRYKSRFPIDCIFPTIPRGYSTFWAAVFGELPNSHLKFLHRRFKQAIDFRDVSIDEERFVELLSPDKLFPRRITSHNLEPSPRAHRRAANVFYLDITKTEDVIDYWNLRALGGDVLPMPRQFRSYDLVRKHVADFLRAYRYQLVGDRTHSHFAHFIKSRSSPESEMAEFAMSLGLKPEASDPSQSPFYALQNWYPRFWDEWQRAHGLTVPDDIFDQEDLDLEIDETERLTLNVPARNPSFAKEGVWGNRICCANEVTLRFYGESEPLAEVFPSAIGESLRRLIAGISYGGDWRVGRNGLVRFVRSKVGNTRNILLAEEVFFAWLKDLGWTARLSPPGILAKQIFKQTRGFPGALADEKLFALLEHMNGGNVSLSDFSGSKSEAGVERALDVGQVVSRLKHSDGNSRLHDWLVSIGAFKLGLRNQCPHCTRRSWFSIDSLGETFTCPKCLGKYPAIGNVSDSRWCYKTAGPFSVPQYADGAYAVLMALNVFIGSTKMGSISATPVMSFIAEAPGKQPIEADFAMQWQQSAYGETNHGLLFGECKTYGRFARKDIERMKQIANSFPGCITVFATLNRTLSSAEKRLIARAARAGRRSWKPDHTVNPVLVLTGNELLHHSGPPYCWDTSTQERFVQVRSLLALSDATQQLYLGLPPLHEEQQLKWQKRRARNQLLTKRSEKDTPAIVPPLIEHN